MRLAEHVATLGGGGYLHVGFWWGNLREEDHVEELEVDGKMVLKRNIQKLDGKAWIRLMHIRIGTVGGLL